jgi:hypothetical protein
LIHLGVLFMCRRVAEQPRHRRRRRCLGLSTSGKDCRRLA